MGIRKDTKKKSRNAQVLVVFILVVIALLVSACGNLLQYEADTDVSNPPGKNKRISVEEAYQLFQDGVFVLDVRTPEEWITGHIPGATLIPLDELAVRSGELPVGEPILIYCRSGNRSLEAMNMLGSVGFRDLSSMDGGIKDWIIAGYPLE
jgi:rhodanese-related sulfurtransferase